jgi:hypothetical protein
MATENVSRAAQSAIHDAIRVDTDAPPAVIFNDAAGAPDLLSYAYGQLRILDETLRALQEAGTDDGLPYALRSIVEPAITAIQIAVKKAEFAA